MHLWLIEHEWYNQLASAIILHLTSLSKSIVCFTRRRRLAVWWGGSMTMETVRLLERIDIYAFFFFKYHFLLYTRRVHRVLSLLSICQPRMLLILALVGLETMCLCTAGFVE